MQSRGQRKRKAKDFGDDFEVTAKVAPRSRLEEERKSPLREKQSRVEAKRKSSRPVTRGVPGTQSNAQSKKQRAGSDSKAATQQKASEAPRHTAEQKESKASQTSESTKKSRAKKLVKKKAKTSEREVSDEGKDERVRKGDLDDEVTGLGADAVEGSNDAFATGLPSHTNKEPIADPVSAERDQSSIHTQPRCMSRKQANALDLLLKWGKLAGSIAAEVQLEDLSPANLLSALQLPEDQQEELGQGVLALCKKKPSCCSAFLASYQKLMSSEHVRDALQAAAADQADNAEARGDREDEGTLT